MITLYDIPSKIPGIAWSPNTFKTRSALNFKGLPYRTEWVEFPDIKPVCQEIGAAPTDIRLQLDGSGLQEHYTLPVIYDSETGRTIAESFAIAEYLDETYPNSPRLFPPGSKVAIALFNRCAEHHVLYPLVPLVLPVSLEKLNEKSKDYFKQSWELWLGDALSDICPPGPKRDKAWEQFRGGLRLIANFYSRRKTNEMPEFFVDNTFSYADIVIGSFLNFPKAILSEEEYDWNEIKTAKEGLWGRIIEELEKYRQVL